MIRFRIAPAKPRPVAATVLLIAFAVFLAGCGQAEKPSATKSKDSLAGSVEDQGGPVKKKDKAKDGAVSKIDCENLTTPDPSEAAGAENKIAVIKTNKGTIKFKFYPSDAPMHVANFIQLATCGFYDGILFHRVGPTADAPNMIQTGDPRTKNPNLTDDGPGYSVPGEFNEIPHVDGTVAMARTPDPDSAGSQFYIAKGRLQFLDNQYTVFGQVIEGLDVVHKIVKGDKMISVTIVEKK